jgi:hypothetical protein
MFELVAGDLEPDMPLTVTMNGEAVDLTDATSIVLHWLKPNGAVVDVTLTAVDLATGQVKRVWETGDSAQTGYHKARVKVTWDTGDVQTYPNDGSWLIWAVYEAVGLVEDEPVDPGTTWVELPENATDPEPAGVLSYLWLDADGVLWKTVGGVTEEITTTDFTTPVTMSDNVTLAATLPGLTNTAQLFRATVTANASTSGDCEVLRTISTGTYDTTAGPIDAIGLLAHSTATRSAGANPLTTCAISGFASGSQGNTALKGLATGSGANAALHVTATGGTPNMAIDADNGGDVSLCGPTDKLGFHGTAPIAKQTGVAVTAEAIHAALVALGLISA